MTQLCQEVFYLDTRELVKCSLLCKNDQKLW